ncbi:MAG: hypothetical protein LBH44_10160 [Treponema sp.]|jgi:hypothetical protein|nr:hypothetical protein [Treponema sp.]
MKIVLAVLIFALLAAPAVFGTEQEVLSPGELRKAFADNPKAAESKYLGNVVQVRGVVVSRGMSKYLTPSVILSDRENEESQAICVLPRLDVGKLTDFTPGQTVIMSGKVYHLSERAIVIKECKAVK